MTDQATAPSGSAGVQAELWGDRARDWADVLEGWNGWGVPIYRHLIERLGVEQGTRVLDVGCGAGRFCRIAADRGAEVSGIDATPALIEIARERILGGDFQVGEMEQLPFEDDSFDVVTGFNSFFIAADMVAALSEVRRVARPGARIGMTVFGRPERCESTKVFASLGELIAAVSKQQPEPEPEPEPEPAPEPETQPEPESHSGGDPSGPPAGADPAPALHEEGGLEAVATAAGLEPGESGYFEIIEEYPDLDTMVRGYLAAAPMRRAAKLVGEDRVLETVRAALGALVGEDGRPRLHDELRYLVAAA